MGRMSLLRRSIFSSLFLSFLCIGSGSLASAWILTHYSTLQERDIFLLLFILSLTLSYLVVFFSLHQPLHRITKEMKALLTGKPYHRIFTDKKNELGILAYFFNDVTRNLESISSEVKSHARIQKELQTAQDIQRLLIPKKAPAIPYLQITAKTRPASEIGGDTFDFFVKDGRNFLYIGDSTGHGIPAALVMVMVDVLLETFIELENSITKILVRLNQYLKPHLRPSMFMTMILMEWKAEEKELHWVGGGHEYLIHVHTKKGESTAIKTGGLAVGMIEDIGPFVKDATLNLEENDFVILYSDGIVEAKNTEGELYGLSHFLEFLKTQARAEISTDALFEKIAIDVGRFMDGQKQLDDMTLIVMKYSKNIEAHDNSTEWTTAT